jgi:ABC-2 type transport system permease protein
MLQTFRQILGISVMCFKQIRTQPLWVFQSIIGVAGLTLSLFAWGSTKALENLILAYFVAGSWALGAHWVAQQIGWDRILQGYDSNVASPMTLSTYFVGIVLGHIPYFLTNVAMAVIAAVIIGTDFLTLLPLFLVSMVSAALGSFLALSAILRLKNPTNIAQITNPLVTLTITLPPIYYPLVFLSTPLKEALLAIPTVSLMEVARLVTGQPTACNPTLSVISLVAWSSISTILLLKKIRWGMD